MNTLYWITRLNAINIISWILLVAAVVIIGVCLTVQDDIGNNYNWNYDRQNTEDHMSRLSIAFIVSIAVGILSILSLIFVPSTKQALIIYGVGGTIDYCKGNEKIKELPDKCVDALDKFLEEYIEE